MGESKISNDVDHDRRRFVGTATAGIAVGSAVSLLPTQARPASDSNAIRPFHISVPDDELVDLRRRVNSTKWPEQEQVTDAS